jgi:hypothetical protein
MRLFRSARWLLLALPISAIPAFAHAQIIISVRFAPLALPVYEQPICPEPNLMWIPGYWAYADEDYCWVPGALGSSSLRGRHVDALLLGLV